MAQDLPPPGSWPSGGSDLCEFGSSPPLWSGGAPLPKGRGGFPPLRGVLPLYVRILCGKADPRPPTLLTLRKQGEGVAGKTVRNPPCEFSHRGGCLAVLYFSLWLAAFGWDLGPETKIGKNAKVLLEGRRKELWRPSGFAPLLVLVSCPAPFGFLAPPVPLMLDFLFSPWAGWQSRR